MGAVEDSAAALLAIPAVQQELRLSDAQRRQVDQIYQTLSEATRTSFADIDFAELPNLTGRVRESQFAAAGRKAKLAGKDAEKALGELLEHDQTRRLAQLRLQRLGARALVDPQVTAELRMTEEQKAAVDKLVPKEAASFGGFGPPAPIPPVGDDLLAVLSDDQRAMWAELVGGRFEFPRPQFPGGFGGPGGPGGMFGEDRKILAEFDENRNGWLDLAERKAARELLARDGGTRRGGPFGGGPFGGPGGGRRGPGGRGGGGGPFGRVEPGTPGPRVDVADVKPSGSSDFYDAAIVRTVFLEFENSDWEAELEAFHRTDVDVPATLTVDGQRLSNVGVRFRGASSYMMLPTGSKRSLNVSLDLADEDQRLYGAKTLNLLNAHEDPSFMHTVLYSRIARESIPAPKANFVRVVINGESWGLYVNAQQFDKIFVAENFGDASGSRWKVPGSPRGGGGLEYLGEDVGEYRSRYEIKSDDNPEAWEAFIDLCRTLNETPFEKLESNLESILDVEGALWFLALEAALINSDGYWVRASDYCIYLDRAGKFHIIPHDMNEVLQPPMGPGMGGGRGGFGRPGAPFGGGRGGVGYELDPLVGLDDTSKPLRSRLLAVPKWRAKYLEHIKAIAEEWLDEDRIGAIVAEYAALIDRDVQADTRKLSSYDAFKHATSESGASDSGNRHNVLLFARERREYLLECIAEVGEGGR